MISISWANPTIRDFSLDSKDQSRAASQVDLALAEPTVALEPIGSCPVSN